MRHRRTESRGSSLPVSEIILTIGVVFAIGLGASAFLYTVLRDIPDEFPWCDGNIPPAGTVIYSRGSCAFGHVPPPGSNFSISSAGGISAIADAEEGLLRGLDPKRLLTGSANGSTILLDVPFPYSTGGRSLIRNGSTNEFYSITTSGLTADTYSGSSVNLDTPVPTDVAGTSAILNAALNQFRGFEGMADITVGHGVDTVLIAPLRWDVSTVSISATSNVDSSVGGALFYRRWTQENFEFAQLRGGVTFSATSPDVHSQLQLDLAGITLPTGLTNTWLGPGSTSCIYKELASGSVAAPILGTSFFAKDDGRPYVVTYVPSAVSGGSTQVDCTFEISYMVAA